jgi:alkylation response protein AidB-like acyl-CoA dehydrogenase
LAWETLGERRAFGGSDVAILTEDQDMLRDMAAAWARERAPIAMARRVRGPGFPLAYDPELYGEMAEMGWTGMVVPEAFGGSDFGCVGMGLVMEALGRTLAPSPLLTSALVAASAIALAGSDAQKKTWLPRIAAGEAVATLAIDEGARHNPAATAALATAVAGGWRLDGLKRPVPEGMAADVAIVVARTSGAVGEAAGLSLFLVKPTIAGLRRWPLTQIDARGAAVFELDAVQVGPEALLGTLDQGATALEPVLDRARAVLSAEMLGAAVQAFETTLEHLRTRVQFGQVLGAFQALQHRAADLLGELELTRSAVEAALAGIDAGDSDTPRLVSLAKALAGDTLRQAANEMIQLHGGIGMTEEHDAGLYLKRARAAEAAYGGASYHRERWSRLSGF